MKFVSDVSFLKMDLAFGFMKRIVVPVTVSAKRL